LRELELECGAICDDELKFLGLNFPNLQKLVLKSTKITDLEVMNFISSQGISLKQWTIEACSDVTEDLINWGTTKGIQVDIIDGEPFGSGERWRRENEEIVRDLC